MSMPPRAPPLPEGLMQAGLCAPQAWAEGGSRVARPCPVSPWGSGPPPTPDPRGTGVGKALPSELGGLTTPCRDTGGPGPKAVTGRDAPLLAGDS